MKGNVKQTTSGDYLIVECKVCEARKVLAFVDRTLKSDVAAFTKVHEKCKETKKK